VYVIFDLLEIQQSLMLALGFTENHLEIPTAFRHGTMEFKVHGAVRLHVGYGEVRGGPEQW
jgi:hypothetical protein